MCLACKGTYIQQGTVLYEYILYSTSMLKKNECTCISHGWKTMAYFAQKRNKTLHKKNHQQQKKKKPIWIYKIPQYIFLVLS